MELGFFGEKTSTSSIVPAFPYIEKRLSYLHFLVPGKENPHWGGNKRILPVVQKRFFSFLVRGVGGLDSPHLWITVLWACIVVFP